jgi:hypothetical protein
MRQVQTHRAQSDKTQLITTRIGDSKIGYNAQPRVHSFRPQKVIKQPDIEHKEISADWTLKGPSRLMLEAFEANELDKMIRKKQNNG